MLRLLRGLCHARSGCGAGRGDAARQLVENGRYGAMMERSLGNPELNAPFTRRD